jgi:hypothetical protein
MKCFIGPHDNGKYRAHYNTVPVALQNTEYTGYKMPQNMDKLFLNK